MTALTLVPVGHSGFAVGEAANVKEYGATGDGTTNDSAAIALALASLTAGGTLLFPPGTYRMASIVTVTVAGITAVGVGATLKLADTFAGTGKGFFYVSGAGSVSFKNLIFDGNHGTTAAATVDNYAIWFTGTSPDGDVRNNVFKNLNSTGSNVNSAVVFATSGCVRPLVQGNVFETNQGGAVFFKGVDSIAIGNRVSVCGDVAFVANGTSRTTFIGNTITGCTPQAAFAVEEGSYDWTITGNTINASDRALDVNDPTFTGPGLGGGIFANNIVSDLNLAGASGGTDNFGIHVRSAYPRDIQITNNRFCGLVATTANSAFVYVSSSTEGLTIIGNTFEGKAQAVNGMVFAGGTHTRLRIERNTIRSTSASTKLTRGIWLSAATVTAGRIADNRLENITNYGVQFDTGSYTGRVQDNYAESDVGAIYQTSPWGTISALTSPHILDNVATLGRSVIFLTAAPTSGTWARGDITWNSAPSSGGAPGWACTTAGTPGTWKAMANLA